MKITQKGAEAMDYFLSLALKISHVEYNAKSHQEFEEQIIYIKQIERLGYINLYHYGGDSATYSLTDLGEFFFTEGGFSKLFKEQQEEEERRKNEASLTKKQINAAKREPYYIGFIIVSTIVNILLAILQLSDK